MSDSGLSSVIIPMDVEYEHSLRRAVRQGLRDGEEVSVTTARAHVEKELGLEAGFFKGHAVWKAKSKDIVHEAFNDPQSSPEKPKAKAKPAVTTAKTGTKRKSNEIPPAGNKRTKKAAQTVPDSDASELSDSEIENPKKPRSNEAVADGGSDEDEKPKAKKGRGKGASKPQAKAAAKRKPAGKKVKDERESGSEAEAKPATKRKPSTNKKTQDVVKSESEEDELPTSKTVKDESELSDAPDTKDEDPPKTNGKPPTPEDDESDMSVLIDDPPPRKKRESKGTTSKAKTTKASKSAATKKKGPDLTPDEEEIKRLQGWLVKVGLKKMWHNELKGCDTDKAKIKHLKKMLEDVGMTGRYSNEKAKGIKEARELADEIAAAQEYEAKWGMKGDEEGGSDDGDGSGDEEKETKAAAAAPRKPKGFVDFGDSGDDSG